MKVIVVGATGTLGKAIVRELGARHDIIEVGYSHGRHQVDITRIESVRALFAAAGEVDAVVSSAGKLHFGPLGEMTSEQFQIGLRDKLLGQTVTGADVSGASRAPGSGGGGRVGQRSTGTRSRSAGLFGFLNLTRAENVKYGLALGNEVVRDDPPVAPPPQGFRAHKGTAPRASECP